MHKYKWTYIYGWPISSARDIRHFQVSYAPEKTIRYTVIDDPIIKIQKKWLSEKKSYYVLT